MKNSIVLIFKFSIIVFCTYCLNCSALKYTKQAPEMSKDAYVIQNSKIEVNIEKVDEFETAGSSMLIMDEKLDKYLIIAHPKEGKFVVASSHCTHRDKALGYNHNDKKFRCSSFGHSEFSLDGTVLKGPAEEPLRIYKSSLKGKILSIYLDE